ncbi:SDR family oxidoreductase [Demequina lutea]|uniref:NAD(P)-dependent dehydrogenase (Short-subunit alcohol dehydrogenase family) n=1 Tax=Demequina lutea TaxID=431489 RepID=A0A7Y9ZC86_9MICO|nr:SDR family oxidoreductase [Demequina lutea]NYI41958.1 NAD(P)-dependent dehydrogenase (short-subunit alcohol dehydrogenase family) [Demequina lutea]
MKKTHTSRVAVVTGGSAGLGRALVRELADRGWDVAVIARGADGLAGAVADIEKRGRRGFSVSADVADAEAIDKAASAIEKELGPIDVWVNDAMAGVFGEFLEVSPADYQRATEVNYLGFVNGTRAALSRMVPRDHGQVIQVGSALAHRGIPLQSAYCGAKHAIKGFTESVVTELGHRGSKVRVSEVDMPALNTIQFNWVKSLLPHHPQPVPPIFQPEVGARVVADVAERPRKRTWVATSTVATIVGNRVASRALDWYLARTGVDGQQAPDLKEPMLPNNLYEPTPGDHGAHGAFDDEAHAIAPQVWLHRRRRFIYAGAMAAAAVAMSTLATRKVASSR